MSVLWEKGPASAAQIAESLCKPPVSRSSVMTLLGVLERKGFVRHKTDERTYVFYAVLDAQGARRTALSTILAHFFGGSVQALMSSLVDEEIVTPRDLQAMRRIIEVADSKKTGRKR